MAVRPAEPGSGSVSSVADVEDQNAGAGDLALDLAVPLLGQLQPARDRLGGPPHLDPVRADREVQAIIHPPLPAPVRSSLPLRYNLRPLLFDAGPVTTKRALTPLRTTRS